MKRIGLVGGPALGLAVALALPETLGAPGRATAAVAAWMAVWWMTEAIPVSATALLPLATLPLLGARTMRETAAPYAHELIFLFMGGFMLALAMERWGLHRRAALLALRAVGTRATAIVAGFMAVAAALSMWVSNTATAIMMLPIATSVVDIAADQDAIDARRFSPCLLLGVAYGASIGGVGTLIGTPPNLFFASFVQEELGRPVSFVRWMGVGLPLVVAFLPLAWWLLTRVLFPLGATRLPADALPAAAPGAPLNRGERATLAAFGLAAFAWVTRPLLVELPGLDGLTDPGIAMLAALSLFLVPADRERTTTVLDWPTAARLPWGLLILFGGGLSLAGAIADTGVGAYLGGLVAGLEGLPSVVLVLGVTALVIFLTELTSNTATTAALLPILAGVAPSLGVPPLLLIVPATVAASCAFMLPVATPPNAVVFGSGRVSIPQMSRAGFGLNLLGIVLITALAYAVALPLLGGAS